MEVAACTIALDNEPLVKALIYRRQLISQIQEMLPSIEDFDIDDLQSNVEMCEPVPKWKQFLFGAATPESVYISILKQEGVVADLSNKVYKVASIFITFQTQDQQQRVLDALTVPTLRRGLLPEEYKYEGITLMVHQPAEPSSIRWDDLNTPSIVRTHYANLQWIIQHHSICV